jgi:hypothetical protein
MKKKKAKKINIEEESLELEQKMVEEAVQYLHNSNYDSVLHRRREA